MQLKIELSSEQNKTVDITNALSNANADTKLLQYKIDTMEKHEEKRNQETTTIKMELEGQVSILKAKRESLQSRIWKSTAINISIPPSFLQTCFNVFVTYLLLF